MKSYFVDFALVRIKRPPLSYTCAVNDFVNFKQY